MRLEIRALVDAASNNEFEELRARFRSFIPAGNGLLNLYVRLMRNIGKHLLRLVLSTKSAVDFHSQTLYCSRRITVLSRSALLTKASICSVAPIRLPPLFCPEPTGTSNQPRALSHVTRRSGCGRGILIMSGWLASWCGLRLSASENIPILCYRIAL